MLAPQRIFGPDDVALRAFGEIALGRALFRLLPEDDADTQPLVSRTGRLALVADIRIDNRDELLGRLGSFSPRIGASDAAIFLACFEKWGEEALQHVLGDYAFALWDKLSQQLLLGRDPLGQRPLYYHVNHGFLAVASRPKAIHALQSVPRAADPDWLIDFIGFVPHRGSGTQYSSIQRVEPGHVVRSSRAGIEKNRFWKPARQDFSSDGFESLRDRLRGELDRAVDARLRRRGCGVGAHLSGGWDSGAVAATAARALSASGDTLLAFTSVPRAGSSSGPLGRTFADEGPVAAAAAAMHDNIQHVLVEGTGASPIQNLDALLSLYDRPVATLCNNVWMSRIRAEAQQRNLCLLLTGEVGNWTISAGSYPILGEYLREGRWGGWWREALALGKNRDIRYRGILVTSLSPWLPRWLPEMAAPLSSGINSASYNPAHPRLRDEISNRRRIVFGTHSKGYYERNLGTLINRDFGDHRKACLAGWGLDERDPTADRRLAEFCLSLPVDMLLKNGERRPLAKAALSDRLPPRVLEQRIKGYQGADWHEGLTASRQAILNLIEEISSDRMAADLLDLPGMRDWVRNWPSGGWEDLHVTARYRTALLVGLSAGHFALRANG